MRCIYNKSSTITIRSTVEKIFTKALSTAVGSEIRTKKMTKRNIILWLLCSCFVLAAGAGQVRANGTLLVTSHDCEAYGGEALVGTNMPVQQDDDQSIQKNPAFAHGEKLTYVVSYKAGINTDVAEVNFMTREVTFNGVKAFQIDANGRVYPFFRWFFDLNDSYYSTLDQKTLRPLELRSEISEGKYRTSSKFTYDWKTKQVHTWFRNHKRETATVKTMLLSEVSYDAVALFFNLRCEDANSFKVGEVRTLEMVLSDTIRRINFRLAAREVRNIKGLGKFRTLKFVCELATSSGESFKDGSEFTIWISDDRNKIPLYLESPIRVGSVRVRLLNVSNLKYPFSSKVK